MVALQDFFVAQAKSQPTRVQVTARRRYTRYAEPSLCHYYLCRFTNVRLSIVENSRQLVYKSAAKPHLYQDVPFIF